MKKILLLDNVPYLLSLLFVGAGWAMTNIVDRIEKLTLVEYKVSFEENKDKTRTYHYLISNITSDKLIEGITLYFDYNNSKGDSIINASGELVPPAFAASMTEQAMENLSFVAPIQYFQPGTRIHVAVQVSGSYPPVFMFSSKQSIMMVERSWKTVLFKNYSWLLVFLIITWVALIIVYLQVYAKNKHSLKPEKQ